MFFFLGVTDILTALSWWLSNDDVGLASGILSIITAFFAFYTGLGTLINPIYDRNILPMGRRSPAKKNVKYLPTKVKKVKVVQV